MCAYSYINGNAACNNAYIETNILRDQWPSPGSLPLTTARCTAPTVRWTAPAGAAVQHQLGALETAVENGTIPQSVLNTMVQRILTEMFRFNLIANPRTGSTSTPVTTPAHQAVGTEVAETSTTLLKNSGSVLPLSAAGGGNVAVIGPAASASVTYGGGGSAAVLPSATVSPLQGIQAAAGPARPSATPRGCRRTPHCRPSRRPTCPPRTRRPRSAAPTPGR